MHLSAWSNWIPSTNQEFSLSAGILNPAGSSHLHPNPKNRKAKPRWRVNKRGRGIEGIGSLVITSKGIKACLIRVIHTNAIGGTTTRDVHARLRRVSR